LRITTPKIKKRLPVFVDESRMDNLFVQLPEPSEYTGILKRAVLELFYATGMRLSELIELQLRDYSGYQVKVLGKRNKERILPLTKTASEALEKYLAQRRKLEKVVDTYHLFLNNGGKKLYPKFVYRVVNTYLGMVTTEKKKSPHVLRHTFATHLLNNGAELNAVKELLGHSSLAATQVYTHNTINKLISIHQKAHPLEEKRKAG
jgi:integrase/recombinase XerC